ncbi:MAG: hypothetical protein PHV30_04795 [Candidatus Margulisbacteria bacterium]|nr:hypothetical protein [Candidatus Margulisiibacteriota bacterium]
MVATLAGNINSSFRDIVWGDVKKDNLSLPGNSEIVNEIKKIINEDKSIKGKDKALNIDKFLSALVELKYLSKEGNLTRKSETISEKFIKNTLLVCFSKLSIAKSSLGAKIKGAIESKAKSAPLPDSDKITQSTITNIQDQLFKDIKTDTPTEQIDKKIKEEMKARVNNDISGNNEGFVKSKIDILQKDAARKSIGSYLKTQDTKSNYSTDPSTIISEATKAFPGTLEDKSVTELKIADIKKVAPEIISNIGEYFENSNDINGSINLIFKTDADKLIIEKVKDKNQRDELLALYRSCNLPYMKAKNAQIDLLAKEQRLRDAQLYTEAAISTLPKLKNDPDVQKTLTEITSGRAKVKDALKAIDETMKKLEEELFNKKKGLYQYGFPLVQGG